jgi:hypothetical protein
MKYYIVAWDDLLKEALVIGAKSPLDEERTIMGGLVWLSKYPSDIVMLVEAE